MRTAYVKDFRHSRVSLKIQKVDVLSVLGEKDYFRAEIEDFFIINDIGESLGNNQYEGKIFIFYENEETK